jgi:Helitron helicase-like domain at N-terminus
MHYVLLFPTGQMRWNPNIPLNGGDVPDEDNNGQQPPPGTESVEGEQPVAPGEEGREGHIVAVRWQRKFVSQMEYIAYGLHPRERASNHLFKAGHLLQEFIVDVWATTEQSCLRWLRDDQNVIRADSYWGLVDAMAQNAEVDSNQLHQCTILPLSFAGST